MIDALTAFFAVDSTAEFWWIVIGLVGQFAFASRFLVQWIVSERARRSTIPVAFWYLSICGGVVLLSYAIYRADPVFILGQTFGVFVYSRNLWLIHTERRQAMESRE